MTPTTTGDKPPGRRERRRAETRGSLLGAAQQLFAEQGVDATRINEITDRADVGFGSFYTYFADKDAIVEAVLHDMTEQHGSAVDALTADLDDPAEVVAVAHRHFVRLAAADPVWGRLVVRLEPTHHVLVRALGGRARRDAEAGIAAGRFHVDDVGLMLHTMGGALLGTILAVLDGTAGDDVDIRHAELVLRMLGMTRRDAAAVARRPLPST
jgi:AcrR family transcriptional regulator